MVSKGNGDRFRSRRWTGGRGLSGQRLHAAPECSLLRAWRRGHLKANPFASMPRLKTPKRRIHGVTAEECERLLGACTDPMLEAFAIVGFQTGLRLGLRSVGEWRNRQTQGT